MKKYQLKQLIKEVLTEITVNQPGRNIKDSYWVNELYEFFKNDQDIFKNSKIDIIIKQNFYNIINLIWDNYTELYQNYDIEEFNNNEIKDYPKTKLDLLDPDKQTGYTLDTEYFTVSEFLFPYILKHLKQNGWEPVITDDWIDDAEFSKDGKEVNIFDYIKPFEDQDTDPRENLYEKFVDYIEDNYNKLTEITVNQPDVNIKNDNIKYLPILNLKIGKYDISKNRRGIKVPFTSKHISSATRNRAMNVFNKLGIKPEAAYIAWMVDNNYNILSLKSTFIVSSYKGEPIIIAQTQTKHPAAGQIYLYSKYFKSGKNMRLPDPNEKDIDNSSIFAEIATKEEILRALNYDL